ncbi:MAG: hypothetical protein Q7V58_05070 [Actinomycetota bacterium]|nr:hypothetical protein [Actinomycetota bacterium]
MADYAAGLEAMERNTGLIFGSCHGYYGAAMRSAIMDVGGTFLGVLREPVKRVHSIYQANYQPLSALAEAAGLDPQSARLTSPLGDGLSTIVAAAIVRRWEEYARHPLAQRARSALSGLQAAAETPLDALGLAIGTLFFGAVRDTFAFDDEVIGACPPSELIQMERMTTDPTYFRDAVWAKVASGRPDVPNPLALGRLNDHLVAADREQPAAALFANWHPAFQHAFSEHLPDYERAHTVYRDMGYFVPEGAS